MARKVYVGADDFMPRDLPDGYVQLEWVGANGPQYINTGLKMKSGYSVTAEFRMTAVDSWACMFGAADTKTNENAFAFWHNGTAFAYYYGTGSSAKFSESVVATDWHTIECVGNSATVDGNAVLCSDAVFSCAYELYLFAVNYGGEVSYPSSMECKRFEVRDENGVLIGDYVPCKNSSGVVGLYDMVGGEFCENAGLGRFIAGAEQRRDIARDIKKMYVSPRNAVNALAENTETTGPARRVKKGFIGIRKVARPFFGEDKLPVYHGAITPLASGRYEMASESNDEYAVFAGGRVYSTSYSRVVEAYNKNLVLTKAADLSVARANIGAAKVGGKVLFAGGLPAKNNYSDVVNSYDSSLTTNIVASLSYARSDVAAAESENHAIFAGGYNGSYFDIVEAYDASFTKMIIEKLPNAKFGATGGSIDEYAVFYDGSAVVAYNKSLVMSILEPFGISTGKDASAVAHEHLLFAAGYENPLGSTSVEAYDKTLVRKAVSPLSVTRGGGGGITLDHYAMFCACADPSEADFMSADVYTPTLTRSVINVEGAENVFFPGAAAIGNYGLLVGGRTSDTDSVRTAHAFTVL